MNEFASSDMVIGLTIVGLCILILAQIWRTGEGDMKLEIKHGVLYVDNHRFSLVCAGNGARGFEPGKWSLEVRYNEMHRCEMVFGPGFGWIGGHPECEAILGNVRGKHAVLADILSQERLRIRVLDALDDGKRVMLEVTN